MTTTSISNLPVELVQLIFIACLPVQGRVKPSLHNVPLVCLQVSKAWREIALETQNLWTRLDLNLTDQCRWWLALKPESNTGSLSGLIEGWLQRAGRKNLAITVQTVSSADVPSSLRRYVSHCM
jgi:hypothetical protein